MEAESNAEQALTRDLDLMLEPPESIDNLALMAAQLAARAPRALHDRKVDALISAPNLMRLPIHNIAFRKGGCCDFETRNYAPTTNHSES